jgi:methionyl-tRNA formyltransferase
MPRKFSISYSKEPVENVIHRDFGELAKANNIPLIETDGRVIKYKHILEEINPDLILVIGWYHIIPKEIRDIAKLGCVGIHGSLLPSYRGGAPLVWAIIKGEEKAGVSLFYFSDKIDAGDIIAQKEFDIVTEDTIKTVYDKATSAAIEVINKYIPMIALGTAPRIKQDESKATIFPQRTPEEGLIDWTKSVKEIKDFIRAQTKPYPGAFTFIKDRKVIIWDADVIEKKE